MKKIYIIRHGETEYNRMKMVQGSGIDSGLNATGRAQAEAFYQMYRDLPFDRVYTSVLKRTSESVAGFLTEGFLHEALPGLNEMSWGHKEGRKITPEDDLDHARILKAWKSGDFSAKTEGGESPAEVLERQKVSLRTIMSRKDEKQILICMHGRAMRIFLCLLTGMDLRKMSSFKHQNLCLYCLEQTGDKFEIGLSNSTVHLKIPTKNTRETFARKALRA